jgi:hypothetical protein
MRPLLLILLLSSSTTFGQLREYGLKLGIIGNAADIVIPTSKNDYTDLYYDYSVYGQFYTDLYQYQNISIRSGIGFLEKNNILSETLSYDSGKPDSIYIYKEFVSNYFVWNTDLKLKAKGKENSVFFPYLFFGPSLQFLNKKSPDLSIPLKRLQFYGMVGVGFDYDLKSINLFAEAQRYVNFSGNQSSDPAGNYTVKSFVLCIGVKYIPKPAKN